METQFNNYLRRYERAETPEQRQALAAQFAVYYDSLSSVDKQKMTKAMHPSLLELKSWTEREIDPLLAHADALLGRKGVV